MALTNLRNQHPEISTHRAISIAELADVYTEMFNLLEDYAPAWYTEELHRRAAAGLETLNQMRDAIVRSSAGHAGN